MTKQEASPDDISPGHNDQNIVPSNEDELRSKILTAERSTLPEGYFLSREFVGTFGGIAFSLAATYFAFQAGAGALININQQIGPSENYYLFSIVWTVSQPISMLLFGRLSDMFGRRNLALGANILGIIGGIIAATSQSINQLIAANVLLGLASGIPGSYPLLTGELMTNKLKFLGTIVVVVPNIIATGFGPYLGLRLSILSSWRWIFYIYIILMVIGTTLWYFFYHPPSFVQLHGTSISRKAELATIDWLGTFLLVSGLVLFLLGIAWGGQPYKWTSGRVLGLLIPGAVLSISFVLYEVYGNPAKPIVPMKFFKDVRGYTCVVIISAITGCLQTALFILWPSQVAYIFGSTTNGWEETAWMSSVVNFAAWAGIIIVGPLFHVIKHLRLQLVVGSAWMTAFLAAMSTITYSNKGSAIAFAFLSTFPIGWGEVMTMLMVQYIVPERDLGVAFAVVSSVRTIMGSIFAAVFVAIYTNKLPGYMTSIVVPALQKTSLSADAISEVLATAPTASQAALSAIEGVTPDILRVINAKVADAYGHSYAFVYYTAAALGAVCLLAALCLRDFDVYLTDHVARMVYKKEETKEDSLAKHIEHPEGV
ncbi:trichothecene efflux pump [Fusarium globosum]|uniref:Trichothecene efflux pump n=1 Tax=Fusarium globosum TaxID=78864 RepID=A0A8H5YIK7_9HYPO|nr:trichothecene efflux pump [Fusarium globosum]